LDTSSAFALSAGLRPCPIVNLPHSPLVSLSGVLAGIIALVAVKLVTRLLPKKPERDPSTGPNSSL